MGKFAVAMPGKIGDALYALQVARTLSENRQETCDFYTSSYCAPMKSLVEYQPYINQVVIPESYRVERMDMGVQPWYMPIDESQYSAVYQLGFRSVPDRPLPEFMALYAGIDKPLKIEYTYPYVGTVGIDYFCIAPRGSSSYANLFYDVGNRLLNLGYGVVIIGGQGENIFEVPEISYPYLYDFTGTDMLQTTAILAGAKGFIGLMSSQLVLANGFDYAKIAPHDGIHWDLRHVIYNDSNFYPVNPSADQVLRLLGM